MESPIIQFSPHKQQQSHIVTTTPTNPLSKLNDDAQILNGGILGRHSVKCNFSTRLTGRFYNDGSLERATFRKSRLVEMQGRKRRLEKEYQLEERRVNVLEERLIKTEQARDDAHEMIVTIERGLIQFQTCIRQRQALKLLRDMQYELYMKQLVAQFFQCHYRGWKGRLEVKSRRNELKRKRRNTSASYIQASYRRFAQRRYYLDLLSERQRISNQSAACIQSMLRMKISREMYQLEMKTRQDGAQTLQRVWRGTVGRMIAEKIRQDLLRAKREAEKPKRIPLHMRRYSTYGSSLASANNNNGQQQRGISSNNNTGVKKRDARMRRRSSDAMIITQGNGRLSSLANFQQSSSSSSIGGNCASDENDSVGSALTFQTNSTDLSFRRRNRPTEKHWPSPQRVIDSHRRATTLQQQQQNSKINCSRRSSLERRKTVSGGGMSSSTSSSATTVPQHHTNKPSLDEQKRRSPLTLLQTTTCNSNDDEADNSSVDESSTSSEESSSSSSDEPSGNDAIDRIAAAAEEGKTPSISPAEETVSLVVQEMIGKTELCHDIAIHSTTFPEFCENEDDLQ